MANVQSRNSISLCKLKCSAAVSVAMMAFPLLSHAQQAANQADEPTTLEAIQVSGDLLGTGLQNSVKRYAGARTVVKKEEIENSGAASISDVMRRIPGVQSTDNSGSAGSAVSLNIGVRGLAGRYSPRSTVLLDGIPMAVAPYGQPQLSFAPVSLNNIESIDVVRGGGAVRYGPQNVGGIINFKTRSIPTGSEAVGDVSVRQNDYSKGGSNTQYSAFAGKQLENGLGFAVLYSGMSGSDWRVGSDEKVNDIALKFRYELSPTSEIYGKFSYYDVTSRTPGGLTTAQYNANPFQNTRPTDFWSGDRTAFDIGYINTISDTQEFEIRTYYNESNRQSTLFNNTNKTDIDHQPRSYQTLGIEPRYTQRFTIGNTTNDMTVGYRYIRERGDDNKFSEKIATGIATAQTTVDNSTDAHAIYIDDKIAFGAWRITPGIRFERIKSVSSDRTTGKSPEIKNNEPLPSLNIAYLLTQDITLFANYGTSFGTIQNFQLAAPVAPTTPLKPELARTTEAGMRWQNKSFSAELTAFNIRFDNQIQSVGSGTSLSYYNLGKTTHNGIETAFDYTFDKAGPFAGLNAYFNYTYTRATLESGITAGNDVPFYARNTDTVGVRYNVGNWGLNLSSTHQGKQFADEKNTVAESIDGSNGVIPGFRLWNAQVNWKVPNQKGLEILGGVNNLTDERYFTRTTDGNRGKLVGAPRMIYLQARLAF
ncbi:TonB-dependent receptor family protein [Herminiimonas contaminans]|uniref:TonB-dependent siderophore receptor n=1 Tax=Herminiimonas contaminans TaxID=1111140 RepID=A0ABS0ESM9_9BURK|nr:TonB-dependent siderophore receptor [Herminiimonas contaminans]MBF8177867.1 TonB-dependent siderophore receptor [Herminiimonas contaminans]